MPSPNLQLFLKNLDHGSDATRDRLFDELQPWLRRVIHMRVRRLGAQRVTDTTDVFQSLVKDFLSRAERGWQSTEDAPLEKYLVGAVQKKILQKLRRERRRGRDLDEFPETEDPGHSIARLVEECDLIAVVRDQLNSDCRQLFDWRMKGYTWPEISEKVKGEPAALRMRLRRAVSSVLLELHRREAGYEK